MPSSSKPYGSLNTAGDEQTPLMPLPLSEERKHEIARRRQAKQTTVFSKIMETKKSLRHTGGGEPTSTGTSVTNSPSRAHRSWLYTLLNPHSKQAQAVFFKRFISMVILVDLMFFILSTDEQIGGNNENLFRVAEGISSTIFLTEYVCRMATITESHKYSDKSPLTARLEYATTRAAVIDLLSTIPFFLELGTGWNLPTLTYLRFFRLLRILKTEGYVRAFDATYRVIYFNSEILTVAASICIFLVLTTGILLYYLRPADEEDAEKFGSIAATLYMSTLMLTGQGGPEGDLPWYTRMVVLLTSIFSVAMFAIPASMLTWGFEAEAERMARRSRQRTIRRLNNVVSSDDETESDDDDSTDDEYFRIIAGEDEEDADASNDTPWMKEMRQKFLQADSDFSGNLTLHEFFELQASIVNAPAPPPALTNASMISRMQALERKVNANTAMLEEILQALKKQ